MKPSTLYQQPVALDPSRHGRLKMRASQLLDWPRFATLPASDLQAAEFADACLEFPIVFTQPRADAPDMVPAAVFGFGERENLFVQGKVWRADYVPARLRAWPFAVHAAADGTAQALIDESCPGLNEGEGTPLFEADGTPSAYTRESVAFAQKLYEETARTQAVCRRLVELQLLEPKRFNLPGREETAGGFFTASESKIGALPDAQVLELHKSGLLGLLHAHHLSLRRVARLVKWREQH